MCTACKDRLPRLRVCVCVCVRACVRVRVCVRVRAFLRASVRACVLTHAYINIQNSVWLAAAAPTEPPVSAQLDAADFRVPLQRV